MKRAESHPDSTVSDATWSHVLRSAAHTLERLPDLTAVLERSSASIEQREAAKRGRQ